LNLVIKIDTNLSYYYLALKVYWCISVSVLKCYRMSSVSTTPVAKTVENSSRAYIARALGVKSSVSGYIHYLSSRRSAFKEENPTLAPNLVVKALAAEWRELSGEAREPYDTRAKEDKERFNTELKAAIEVHGSGPLPEFPTRPKRAKKEKKMTITRLYDVKGAKSAYIFFGKQVRAKIVKKNPEASTTEILGLIAAEWKKASDAAKKKCEKKAEDDKERFNTELKAAILEDPEKLSQLPEKTCARYRKKYIVEDAEVLENTVIGEE
jgi:hypothetical protein